MNKKEAEKKVAAMKKNVKVFAQKELAKAKAEMAKAAKKVEAFVKKNPEKAAIISAGIGAAIGAAVVALVSKKKK
jgi:ElaB/YqjD/DUF883 family membrane-anchored ribosome-binding protein